MAMKALTTTLDDTTADQAWLDAGGYGQSVPTPILILLRNLQFQVNALTVRVAELELAP